MASKPTLSPEQLKKLRLILGAINAAIAQYDAEKAKRGL